MDYWQKHKAQRMYDAMNSAELTATEIAKVYKKSSMYLSNEMKGIFERYKTKNGLSDKEAKALLNTLIDPTDYSEMLKKLNAGAKTKERRELLKMLESPAYSYRIKKLEKLQQDIDNLMNDVYKVEKDITTNHYISTAYDEYFKSIYDIQNRTKLGFNVNGLSSTRVDRLLKSKWVGNNYSNRIWNNTQSLAHTLKQEFLVCLLTGKTHHEVSNLIQDKYNVAASDARRLIRTESTYMHTQAE